LTVDLASNLSSKRELTLNVGVENFPDWLIEELGCGEGEPSDTDTEDIEIVEEDLEIQNNIQDELTGEKERSIIKYRVLDSEGNPLPYTVVVIDGEKYISDENGYIYVEEEIRGADVLIEGKTYSTDIVDNNIRVREGGNFKWYIWCVLPILLILVVAGVYLYFNKEE